jgi:hypothetical protein
VGFLFWAAAKSRDREGSLGEVRVGEVVVAVGLAGVNCDVSSASWLRRRGSCEVMELETATVSSMAMFLLV